MRENQTATLQPPLNSNTTHQTRIRVRYAETDQMGVVYYANYFIWMEIGRVEFVRACGLNYKELEHTEGLFLAVAGADCRYLYPARYDQEILIQTRIVSANPRMLEFAYEFRSTDHDRLLAQGSTKHVWLNRDMRPTRLPEKYCLVLRQATSDL